MTTFNDADTVWERHPGLARTPVDTRVAAVILELEKERDDARAEAVAWRERFDGEMAGGEQLREHLGAQEKETVWGAAERVRRENDILKDALSRVAVATDLEAIQRLVRAAQVKVWGEI